MNPSQKFLSLYRGKLKSELSAVGINSYEDFLKAVTEINSKGLISHPKYSALTILMKNKIMNLNWQVNN